MYPLGVKMLDLPWTLVKYCRFSTSALLLARQKSNHYGNLELDENATQNEIKTAYYRLSKMYHPDMNKGSDQAATKFREITAAYEVLGNVKTRKLYDRGLANTESIYEAPSNYTTGDIKEDENVSSFYKTRPTRKPSKFYTGRTEAYNFDEWTRAHYSSTFTHQKQSKEKTTKIREMNAYAQSHWDSDLAPTLFLLTCALVLMVNFLLWKDYDNPLLVEQQKAMTRKAQEEKAKLESSSS